MIDISKDRDLDKVTDSARLERRERVRKNKGIKIDYLKLRRRRESLCISREEMAEDLEISTCYVGRIERGERGNGVVLDILNKICLYLDMPLTSIIISK